MTLDLDAIQARADAATKGPWFATSDGLTHPGSGRNVMSERDGSVAADCCGYQGASVSADADFIAHAREDIPALIARVRELEQKNTNLGITRSRAADALDRVALYGKNLTEVFRPETTECEIGGEILRRIVSNPLPSEGGPQ